MITDFHIHSSYARGCSNRLTVEGIWKTCIIKGIDIVGTGDFTHPDWFKDLKKFLQEDGKGFLIPKDEYLSKRIEDIKPQVSQSVYYKIKKGFYPKFVFQTEINSVFQRKKDSKGKFTIKLAGEDKSKSIKKARIHNVILTDSFKNAEKILNYLSNYGKVESDGRLAVRQDQADTLFWLKKEIPSSIFFPAHIWTPYFGVLGSKFGFTSLKEAFVDSYFLVDGVETGLSSDPIMNWINEEIDPFVIVSNSDAHSLENLGREGNVIRSINGKLFLNFTYKDLEKIFKYRKYKYFYDNLLDIEKSYLDNLFVSGLDFVLDYTIEFYPQEGKYFGDGHGKCEFSTTPAETIQRQGKCPICGKQLVIGVFHRCADLGDKNRIVKIGFGNKYFWSENEINNIANIFSRPKYKYFVPLWDIIFEVWGKKKGTKSAQKIYNDLIYKFGPEFYILLDLPLKDAYDYDKKFGLALEKVRKGNIYIKSGYDGIYGIVKIFEKQDVKESNSENDIYKQNTLF